MTQHECRALLDAALATHRLRAEPSALRLPRKTFYDKLAKYGLKPEEFR